MFFSITIQKPRFFGVQLSLWSNSHIHTWLLGKLRLWRPMQMFVCKAMSLLFNTLSGFICLSIQSHFLWFSCPFSLCSGWIRGYLKFLRKPCSWKPLCLCLFCLPYPNASPSRFPEQSSSFRSQLRIICVRNLSLVSCYILYLSLTLMGTTSCFLSLS